MTEHSAAANGWTYLPSGMLFQWGTFTFATGATQVFAFPKAFATAVYSVNLTPLTTTAGQTNVLSLRADLTASLVNFSARSKTLGNNDEVCKFYFQAIGV